jgi:hypothetical protein
MRLLKHRAEYEMYADVILVSIDSIEFFENFSLILDDGINGIFT